MTIDLGDVYLADLGHERRRHVLVVSNQLFNRSAGRVLVAPEIRARPPEPWFIAAADRTFAVDRTTSVRVDRLLGRAARATAAEVATARRALRHIT
jgi:mRNA-degrading endonuclease toxin of MazEF toxin-antitoxin module